MNIDDISAILDAGNLQNEENDYNDDDDHNSELKVLFDEVFKLLDDSDILSKL